MLLKKTPLSQMLAACDDPNVFSAGSAARALKNAFPELRMGVEVKFDFEDPEFRTKRAAIREKIVAKLESLRERPDYCTARLADFVEATLTWNHNWDGILRNNVPKYLRPFLEP